MNPDRWQRLDELYHQALGVPFHERAAFLGEACQGDTALQQEIESLLRLQAGADGFLEQPAVESAARTLAAVLPALRPPEIPGYRLIRELGEGGMGLVYLAEQQTTLHRLVALKLIRPGMDSRQVVARFNAERQALALMDHPNIAAVYDAGSTPDGVPYFVMEFVDGVPMTEFCDRARLSMRGRLELFLDVCAAVQHAHQKGVIHRDLKPSNVLVAEQDHRAVVKVIDFGTAKAIEGHWRGGFTLTAQGMVLGTIEYMSPEQAAFSRDIDTTTDVYSLGVMLYELLVGALPFERPRPGPEGYDDLRRLIRESDPPRPSTRLAVGRTDHDQLSRSLEGDLDWITLKALEKDRTRRYATVAALAADIQRFLSDQPIEARPPSAIYRLRKFTRRHRGGVAAAAALGVVMAAGLIASTSLYLRADRAAADATRQRSVAESERTRAEQAQAAAELAAGDADAQRRIADEQRRLASNEAQRTVAALRESEYRNYVMTIGAADVELREGRGALARARLSTVPVAQRGWEWSHLFLRADSSLFTLADTSPCPTSPVSFLHRLVAAREPHQLLASHCNRVIRWDTRTAERAVVSSPADTELVTTSASGRRLVRSGVPGRWQVAVVDRLEDRSTRVLMVVKQPPLCADFSPDSVFVAMGFPGGPGQDEFGVWNVQSGLRVQQWRRSRGTFPATTPDAYCVVRFSPDGALVAASGAALQVLDIRSGTERFADDGLGVVAQSIAFSPGGTRLAVGRRNGTVDIVDLASGALTPPLDASQFGRPLPLGTSYLDRVSGLRERSEEQTRAVVYTPDGRFLVSAVSNRIAVWDLPAARMIKIFDGHGSPIADLAIGSNGLLYSADRQGTIRAWDLDGSIGITRLGPTSSALACLGIAQKGTIVAMGVDGSLDIWQTGDREPLRLKPANMPGQRESGNVALPSTDGRFVVTSPWTEGETSLALWSVEARRRVETLPSTLHDPDCGVLVRVQFASMSVDDRYLAYGHGGCVVVRDLSTSRTVAKLNLSAATGRDPALSYQSNLIIPAESVGAGDVQFRPDGLLYVTSVRNRQRVPQTRAVMVWDWRANRVLTLHTRSAVSATNVRLPPLYWAVSADGRRVALTGFVPDAVSIWDAQLTREVSRLPASGGTLIAFTADGRRIATAHPQNDPAVRVWDTETGQLLLTLTDIDSHRGDIAFTSDGRLIAGLVSGGITIWETRKATCARCPTRR
jgi:serine/threonine protein kinase/WD40 repeat protein